MTGRSAHPSDDRGSPSGKPEGTTGDRLAEIEGWANIRHADGRTIDPIVPAGCLLALVEVAKAAQELRKTLPLNSQHPTTKALDAALARLDSGAAEEDA